MKRFKSGLEFYATYYEDLKPIMIDGCAGQAVEIPNAFNGTDLLICLPGVGIELFERTNIDDEREIKHRRHAEGHEGKAA